MNESINLDPGQFHIYSNFYIDPPEDNLLSTHTQSVLLPNSIEIMQNYPNPFNPSTLIQISSSGDEQTSLQIFDINGKLVDTLMDRNFISGINTYQWNASSHPSGVYLVRMKSGEFTQTQKVLLVK